jgi:hypothetical protein
MKDLRTDRECTPATVNSLTVSKTLDASASLRKEKFKVSNARVRINSGVRP